MMTQKELGQLTQRFKQNTRSVFISYAWPDGAVKSWAKRLHDDLAKAGFDVFLDQAFTLDINEVLALLRSCHNVIMIADGHYVDSCLLGQVPVTRVSSPYPSFAFPSDHSDSAQFAVEVFKISAVVWEVARQGAARWDNKQAGEFALQVAAPKSFPQVPGLRIFLEGWRVDENQIIIASESSYGAIATAYRGPTTRGLLLGM